jgi:predicted aldo/keto reductase-like oxidoreductase
VTYFDCARSYWDGRSEEAYGIGLKGVRKNVFLPTQTQKRTAKEAEEDLATSLRLLKTDYLDLWQVHAVQNQEDIDKILSPGGALEALEAAKKAGKCRLIGFTGHYDPETHTTLLKAYDGWDTVMMPIHAADHSYLSFEEMALPVAAEGGVGVQPIGRTALGPYLHDASTLLAVNSTDGELAIAAMALVILGLFLLILCQSPKDPDAQWILRRVQGQEPADASSNRTR